MGKPSLIIKQFQFADALASAKAAIRSMLVVLETS